MKNIKLSGKGQIAIPQEIRKNAKLEKGDNLVIMEENGTIMIKKTERVAAAIKDDFKDLLKHSEKIAQKLWSNKEDDIWDNL